jgi:hypothetical protein
MDKAHCAYEATTRHLETARSPPVDGSRAWSTEVVLRLKVEWACDINPLPEKELGNGAC